MLAILNRFDIPFFIVSSVASGSFGLPRRRYTSAAVPGLENIEFPVASAEDTVQFIVIPGVC